MTIAEAPEFDVLLVPGGYGQQELLLGIVDCLDAYL
jgi:hypothetical protein